MSEIDKIDRVHAAHNIARSSNYYGNNNLRNCVFLPNSKDVQKNYFENKKELTQQDISNVYYDLYNKFVSTTEELNSLAKKRLCS